ncbi:class III extradiol ring-cleavage dioxygenase [Niveispirillum sp. BGYR6]|uniref:DODA-type extradiol aromatic ring-opening family dioxygenase n=1 Tax=Niveispirillum sp. BGYR6 TaxID=2971249 RepID=UPI0022B94A15|nr:class III extradiol ring-cleavage dioxygenase [Niveispirillum sp. BGYR6]MDG5495868.1 class III extradiol ring-cleavage dioxygenase [Niveispirillum sp. BGYR6]
MSSLPAIFISHGSPMLALEPDAPAHHFLRRLGELFPRPQAILAISAHWETPEPALSLAERPETIHDFRGFPPALFAMRYPAPGAPALAHRAGELLAQAGIRALGSADRGLDHGAWTPLTLAFPDADIPVTQLSVQPDRDAGWHARIGAALRPLRDEGVLILGSGSFTHNLMEMRYQAPDAPVPDWVNQFADWMRGALLEGRQDAALDWLRQAPEARRNHPTTEHLLPLFVAMGVGTPGAPARLLHSSTDRVILAMDAFAFD